MFTAKIDVTTNLSMYGEDIYQVHILFYSRHDLAKYIRYK